MMVALLVLLVATWITWVLFRDDRFADQTGHPVPGEDTNRPDRERRAGE